MIGENVKSWIYGDTWVNKLSVLRKEIKKVHKDKYAKVMRYIKIHGAKNVSIGFDTSLEPVAVVFIPHVLSSFVAEPAK